MATEEMVAAADRTDSKPTCHTVPLGIHALGGAELPIPDGERNAARLRVAGSARDVDDLRYLLDVLGLVTGGGE